MSLSSFKYVFKYIIIGNPSVGKSCILNQFLNSKFSPEYEITVGVEFGAKTIDIEDGSKVKLQIWDTAGQESFKSITRSYYRAAAVAIVVYDITARESFESIVNWLEECKANGNPEMTLVLVGNKTDLESRRMVPTNEAAEFAKKNNMIFFETSAKTAERITDIFVKSANAVNAKIVKGVIDPKVESFGVKLGAAMPAPPPLKQAMSQKKLEEKNCCN